MQITKREIIASVVIFSVLMIIGFFISNSINQNLLEEYQIYDTALKIDSDETMFRRGIETNIGFSFVYGELDTLDPVTYSEIGGAYSYIKKEEQEYRKHTRIVTEEYTDSKGKTHTRSKTETYWTWDTMHTESKTSTRISFLNIEFSYEKIPFPGDHYIKTISTGYHRRNVYYGTGTNFSGTIFTSLKDNTINNTKFYNNSTISETIQHLESGSGIIVFWIFWILLIAGSIFVFYFLENRWLNK